MSQAKELYVSETTEKKLDKGHLRLALVALSVVALVAVFGCVWLSVAAGKSHAYVVRIEPGGRTEVVSEGYEYTRQPQEAAYFIKEFCKAYFSRDRLTIDALPKSLAYFYPHVGDEIGKAWHEAKTFENVARSPVQVDAEATEVNLTRDGKEAYVTVRLDRSNNGQKESQNYSTYLRFDCFVCDRKPVPKWVDTKLNPLGFALQNVPTLEALK